MSSIKQKFGKRIKELRKNSGYTQEQMAELVSIEPPNLSKIECGMHFPQPEKIEKMAQALNVEIAELFDFEHYQERNKLLNITKNTLDSFDNKKLQLAYKLINAIKLY